ILCFFFFQAEDGIRDGHVTGVQTCALPILRSCVARSSPQATSLHSFHFGNFALRSFLWKAGIVFARSPMIGSSHERTRSNCAGRSEERRVGKECRSRWTPDRKKEQRKKRE